MNRPPGDGAAPPGTVSDDSGVPPKRLAGPFRRILAAHRVRTPDPGMPGRGDYIDFGEGTSRRVTGVDSRFGLVRVADGGRWHMSASGISWSGDLSHGIDAKVDLDRLTFTLRTRPGPVRLHPLSSGRFTHGPTRLARRLLRCSARLVGIRPRRMKTLDVTVDFAVYECTSHLSSFLLKPARRDRAPQDDRE
jgi:hypothetical protein